MLNTININLKTDISTDRPTSLPITLMSQDKNNNKFILRFTNGCEQVVLDDTYTVDVLTKFTKSGTSRLTTAIVTSTPFKANQDYVTWEFDTSFITQNEEVRNYVYVRKSGNLVVSADANCFVFNVGLSEIDKGAGKVAETYDENYQKYLDEFKGNVDFEEIAQAELDRKAQEEAREVKFWDWLEYAYSLNPGEGSGVDLSSYATKDYVDTAVSNVPIPDLSNYALKSHTHSEYALSSALANYVTETELQSKNYITLSQVPKESFTKAEADLLYQEKGDYATKSDLANAQLGGGDQEIDLTNYVTETELEAKNYITLAEVPQEQFTKSVADGLYQPKGSYLTRVPTTYQTTSQADSKYQTKGNYLTSIPDEYVTEAELNSALGDIETILASVVGVV